MEPTEQDVEALEDELSRVWHDASSDRRYSFNAVARHVLSRPAPPGTIRLGTGLTDEQRGWSAKEKLEWADKYDADVDLDLMIPGLFAGDEREIWKAIHIRFRQMATDLRAAADPPVDPRIAVVRAEVERYQSSSPADATRAILAALDAAGGKE